MVTRNSQSKHNIDLSA